MGRNCVPRVYLVDDDPAVLDALSRLLISAGLAVETFASAEDFLTQAPKAHPSCLILDVRMAGMTGLELQRQLDEEGYAVPIIILTAYADVSMAVDTMRAGAVEVLEKPVDPVRLLAAIESAIELQNRQYRLQSDCARTTDLLAELTPREREVLDMVVAGKATKVIASELGTSQNTVKNQRARVLAKMQADCVADLVRKVIVSRSARLSSQRPAQAEHLLPITASPKRTKPA